MMVIMFLMVTLCATVNTSNEAGPTQSRLMPFVSSPPINVQFALECVPTGVLEFECIILDEDEGSKSTMAGAISALHESTITIDNSARGTNLVVRSIECGGGLCAGATFRILNADYGDIKYEEYIGCGDGCMVENPAEAFQCGDLMKTLIFLSESVVILILGYLILVPIHLIYSNYKWNDRNAVRQIPLNQVILLLIPVSFVFCITFTFCVYRSHRKVFRSTAHDLNSRSNLKQFRFAPSLILCVE